MSEHEHEAREEESSREREACPLREGQGAHDPTLKQQKKKKKKKKKKGTDIFLHSLE